MYLPQGAAEDDLARLSPLQRGWQVDQVKSEGSCQECCGAEPDQQQHPGERAHLPGGQAGEEHHQADQGAAAG